LEGCSANKCVNYFRTFHHALVSCDAPSVLSPHAFVTTVRFAFTFGNVLRPSCGFICDPVYPHRNTFRFCRLFFLLVHYIHEFFRSPVLRQPLDDGNGASEVFERLPGLPDELRTNVTSQGSIVRELDEKEVVLCGSRVKCDSIQVALYERSEFYTYELNLPSLKPNSPRTSFFAGRLPRDNTCYLL
jgi:hypothetical protein